jgi:hypothetical protein
MTDLPWDRMIALSETILPPGAQDQAALVAALAPTAAGQAELAAPRLSTPKAEISCRIKVTSASILTRQTAALGT